MQTPPTVLIAPDKFKGSVTAPEVVAALSRGLRKHVEVNVRGVPIADGGDGTLTAALAAGYDEVPLTVTGPTGLPVNTRYARLGPIAVIELADACGLMHLTSDELAPLTASSRGAGEVMATALRDGCTELVLGIGGSASTDGGAGMLAALGARLLDAQGHDLADGGAALADLASLELDSLKQLLGNASLTVACDVDNPLTGPDGAAQVYGTQKGASGADVVQLNRALAHFADVVSEQTVQDLRDHPGAGAAGGVGFAAVALLGASLSPGVALVLDLTKFHDALPGCDLVITGEGSLDEQTLHGKAPMGVAVAAAEQAIDVVAVCGRTTLPNEALQQAGFLAVYPLTELEPDVGRSMANAGELLEQVGEQIAKDFFPLNPTQTA